MRPARNVPTVSTSAGASNTIPLWRDHAPHALAVDAAEACGLLLEQRQPRLVLQLPSQSRGGRAAGRPARASPARPGPCWHSRSETEYRRDRPRAPWRRRARRSRAPDDPCRYRRWPDCSSSPPGSRCSASAAGSGSPCGRPPARPRSRHGHHRPRSHRMCWAKRIGRAVCESHAPAATICRCRRRRRSGPAIHPSSLR
jgi:hypothetical protein